MQKALVIGTADVERSFNSFVFVYDNEEVLAATAAKVWGNELPLGFTIQTKDGAHWVHAVYSWTVADEYLVQLPPAYRFKTHPRTLISRLKNNLEATLQQADGT